MTHSCGRSPILSASGARAAMMSLPSYQKQRDASAFDMLAERAREFLARADPSIVPSTNEPLTLRHPRRISSGVTGLVHSGTSGGFPPKPDISARPFRGFTDRR